MKTDATLTVNGLWLRPGRYTVDVFVCRAGILDSWEGAAVFEVLAELPYPGMAPADAYEKGLVLADFTYLLPANVEHLTWTGTADIDATGNTLANTLTGNSGDNVLDGGPGDDSYWLDADAAETITDVSAADDQSPASREVAA